MKIYKVEAEIFVEAKDEDDATDKVRAMVRHNCEDYNITDVEEYKEDED